MAVIVDRRAAAEALDVSERTLDRWKLDKSFPPYETGYDIDAINRWREDNAKKGTESDSMTARVNLAIKSEKLKEMQRKNQLLQMEIDAKNRDLIPTALVHELLMECAGLIRGVGQSLQKQGNDHAARLIEQQVTRFKKIVSDKLGTARDGTER